MMYRPQSTRVAHRLRSMASPFVVGVAALGVAAALTVGAATGILAWFDRLSLEHVMPARASVVAFFGRNANGQPAVALTPPHPHLAHDLHLIWAPFSRAISSVVVAALCAYSLRRRPGWSRPAGWLVGFLLANLVAFALQEYLRRPEIVVESGSLRYAVVNYAASFPSGYGVRAVFIGLVVAALWPRLRGAVVAVTLVVLAAIVAGASHLPTDVAGGIAFAGGFFLVCPSVFRALAAKAERRAESYDS